MDYNKAAIELHKRLKGKIEVTARAETNNKDELSTAYTPGVAEPCREIAKDIRKVYDYTRKGNLVAVVTDGSAVLGLGNIGPGRRVCRLWKASACCLKNFAGVDAFPICLDTNDVDEIVETVKNIAPTFGGINLEGYFSAALF